VFGVHDVPPPFIVRQMELVIDDIGVDAIKTGMLSKAEVIAAINSIVPGFDVELEPGSSVPPSYLDIARLHQDTGYQPEWDTERSVADYIAYFRAARELGAPVLCNVSSDEWIARKHPPLLLQHERVAVIDAIRFIDYTHAAASTTADVLGRLGPRFYVKGADWRDRLPKEELEVCAREGVEIVFLETVIDSSTDVLRRHLERTRTA